MVTAGSEKNTKLLSVLAEELQRWIVSIVSNWPSLFRRIFMPLAVTLVFIANQAYVATKELAKAKIAIIVATPIFKCLLPFFFIADIKNPIVDIDNWLSFEDPIVLRHHIAVVLPLTLSYVLYTRKRISANKKENHRNLTMVYLNILV